jgi:TetR/AcrR family transcriptional regulator, transcriptional repressor of aconitase
MPRVSQEHADARKRQILEGAQRAFAQHGYGGATVARIEQETGLSRGAIFNYFGSKQDLFVELALDASRKYTQVVIDNGVDAAVRAMAAEDPAWLGVLLEAHARLRHDPEFTRKLEAAYETAAPRLGPWIEERQADGTFRDDVEAVDLGRYIAMVINGFALRVLGGEETDVEALLRLLNDTLAPRK